MNAPRAATIAAHEGSLDDFFENGNVGLHLVAGDGTILRANRADYEPLGYEVDEYVGRHIAEFHADREVIEDILARLSRGERLDKYPARLRAKDGSIRHVQISSSVCFRNGEFVNTRCFTVDVTERMQTEAALREAQERLAITYENVLAGIGEVDGDGRFLRVNEAFCDIAGRPRADLLRSGFLDLTHPEDVEEDRTQFARQVRGEIDRYRIEKRYVRPDGRILWVEVISSTVRDQARNFAYGVRMVLDITARKEAERRQKLLLDELNHRVKNTLATVQSLAAQTARTSSSAEEFRARFEPRLIALSKAHDRLTRNRWEGANLKDIIQEELAPYSAPERRLSIEGPDLILPPRASLSLSLALHELATNAAKHGALSVHGGSVEVAWEVHRDASPFPQSVSIRWTERGGPEVTPPQRSGFGSRLLRVTAEELDGRMEQELAPSGLDWRLHFPLSGAESGFNA
jgi:PAS domain S-box-containing protein